MSEIIIEFNEYIEEINSGIGKIVVRGVVFVRMVKEVFLRG